jgi:hypothetical protein
VLPMRYELNLYIYFLNPILFAICTRTLSKLCVTYTLTWRIELSSSVTNRFKACCDFSEEDLQTKP